jgi:hypothetical protein
MNVTVVLERGDRVFEQNTMALAKGLKTGAVDPVVAANVRRYLVNSSVARFRREQKAQRLLAEMKGVAK